MSDLATGLDGLRPIRPGGVCKTCALIDGLEEADATALRRVLAVPKNDPGRVSSQQLVDYLTGMGHDVSEQSVSKHRRARHG